MNGLGKRKDSILKSRDITLPRVLPSVLLGCPFHKMITPLPQHFSSVQSLSHVRLFATLWTAACQAALSITNSRSLPKFMSIESVMPSTHLILCRLLLLLPSIFPSIRVFSNESALHIRWPKYWSFSFNCYSHAFQETDSLRRTMQIVKCSLLRRGAQGRVSS